MKRILRTAALSLYLFAAETALAADGFVTGDVELRAGPDPDYPSVAMLSDGTSVSIMGCVDNWSWCDVATGPDRGWVPGDFLQEEYQGQRVFVPEYAAVIGIPVVTFTFAAYWDAHYRQRPFYAERERYVHVQPAFRPPAHRPQTQPQPRAQPPQPANQGRAATVPQEHPASPQNRLPQKEEINSGKRMEPQARPNEPANASSRPTPAERRAPEANPAAGQPKAAPKPAAKPATKPQPEKGKEDKGKEEKKDQQG